MQVLRARIPCLRSGVAADPIRQRTRGQSAKLGARANLRPATIGPPRASAREPRAAERGRDPGTLGAPAADAGGRRISRRRAARTGLELRGASGHCTARPRGSARRRQGGARVGAATGQTPRRRRPRPDPTGGLAGNRRGPARPRDRSWTHRQRTGAGRERPSARRAPQRAGAGRPTSRLPARDRARTRPSRSATEIPRGPTAAQRPSERATAPSRVRPLPG